jgi:hypothetical protein
MLWDDFAHESTYVSMLWHVRQNCGFVVTDIIT